MAEGQESRYSTPPGGHRSSPSTPQQVSLSLSHACPTSLLSTMCVADRAQRLCHLHVSLSHKTITMTPNCYMSVGFRSGHYLVKDLQITNIGK